MTHCDHQFQNVDEKETKNTAWIPWKFVCPFCGQIREVSKEGEIEIKVKGRESPKP